MLFLTVRQDLPRSFRQMCMASPMPKLYFRQPRQLQLQEEEEEETLILTPKLQLRHFQALLMDNRRAQMGDLPEVVALLWVHLGDILETLRVSRLLVVDLDKSNGQHILTSRRSSRLNGPFRSR